MTVFKWDSKIKKSSQFVTLPEGDYDCEITELEREWYDGGNKLPACPMAVLTVTVHAKIGDAVVKERLRLCSELEWLISSFFESIGMKEKDEEIIMDWDHVVGKKGRVHVIQTKGTKNPDQVFNQISRWLPQENKKGFGNWNK